MTDTTEIKKLSDQKYRQTEAKAFDKYDDARLAYNELTKKLKCRKPNGVHDEPNSAHRIRIKLRRSGKFELVTFELIKETKEDVKNA